jgi:hypothetical protein
MEAEMHIEVACQLQSTPEPLSLIVGDDIWDLYVFGVTRIARDWWVQVALVGPRSCTVTVRVDAARGRGAAAHQILELIRDWLRKDEVSGHALLEHPSFESRAS